MKTQFRTGNQAGQQFVQNLPSHTGHAVGYSIGFLCGMTVGTAKGVAKAASACVPKSVKTGFRKSQSHEQPAPPVVEVEPFPGFTPQTA